MKLTAHWLHCSADGFFPWHRWFLYLFEELLRGLGPRYQCISIPYWDWSRMGTAVGSDVWNAFGGSFSGCVSALQPSHHRTIC